MGLFSDTTVVSGIACAAIYSLGRVLALLVVLRGTTPEERAQLIRATAQLYGRRRPTRR